MSSSAPARDPRDLNRFMVGVGSWFGSFGLHGVLFSTLLGWLLWSELPDALSGVGALLVIAAGVTALRERSARVQTL